MIANAIMEVGPKIHIGVILRIESQGLQVELALGIHVVVALVAI
jgi:hypothetical protein